MIGVEVALQIANPVVVSKVERLAAVTGLTKTGAVERAVDLLLSTTQASGLVPERVTAILSQLDALPRQGEGTDPLEWDENGLPR